MAKRSMFVGMDVHKESIDIPTPDDEALRDLVRAREEAVGLSTHAKHRLQAFLLRQGRRYPGRAGSTRPYRRWRADLGFPSAPQHIALQEDRDTIDAAEQRLDRLSWRTAASCRRNTRVARAGGAGAARVRRVDRSVRSAAAWPGGEPSRTLWTSASSTRPSRGRGSSATNHSLGGTQPADISRVNRR